MDDLNRVSLAPGLLLGETLGLLLRLALGLLLLLFDLLALVHDLQLLVPVVLVVFDI